MTDIAGILVHTLRVVLVGLLLLLLHRPPEANVTADQPPTIDKIREVISAAQALVQPPDSLRIWDVLDHNQKTVGRVARTLPQAAAVRGYRGPTEALLVLDDLNRIKQVSILGSRDTIEHVEIVRHDARFLAQFQGWQLGSTATATKIDGVSGATLTSLAFASGILQRLGVANGSLVFPDDISAQEASELADFQREGSTPVVYRTGIYDDGTIGYQGPTEMLIAVSREGNLLAAKIRKSFDNEAYVDYVRTDKYFWKTFIGKPLNELAESASGVEGVSGATMTSQAIAETLAVAAGKIQLTRNEQAVPKPSLLARFTSSVNFSWAEIATVVILLLALGYHRFARQHKHWVRRIWLISTIVVLGVWAGNLLSLSLIAGWSQSGVGWQIAPGLTILVIASLLVPPLTKANPYCSHMCPHGAIQQLIRPKKSQRRHVHVSGIVQRVLKFIPAVTLAIAYAMLLFRPDTELASWEPFHAYLYPIAGVVTVVIAIASLIVASMVPMGYCRFGCPTGSLLDYLRRSAASRRVGMADALVLALAVLAASVRFGFS